jgi:hypothetical protein
MRARQKSGKGNDVSCTGKKVALLILLVLFMLSITASAAEASVSGSIKNTWSKMRNYVKSGAFWLNVIVFFAIGFIIYSLTLGKSQSDTTQKVMMYLLIGVVAVIIATKIVAENGAPQFIWHNNQFRRFTQFMIGPSTALGDCEAPPHSFWRSLTGIEPNPPCCGDGAYQIMIRGDLVCKQALLRINNNGSGLPALIVSFLLFMLLFSAFGKNLGMDGDSGKWIKWALTIVLSALVTNQRITKNNLVIIGGWIAFILIGKKLAKSMSGDKDGKGGKAGFGYGLAFALVQLIANMLGTSLFGGNVNAGEIGFNSIVINIFWGLLIGYAYGALFGEGILGKINEKRRKEKEADVQKLIDDGKIIKPFLRSLPIIGRFWRPKDAAAKSKKDIKKVVEELSEIKDLYTAPTGSKLDAEMKAKITRLEDRLADLIKKGP